MSQATQLVFLGPPGAGKGTQARILSERFGLGQLSTGDALRAAVAAQTDAGKAAQSVMEAGGLVSDEIVNAIVAKTIDGPDFRIGTIFDGYPRTINQAEALDEMLKKRGEKIAVAISLEVDEKALIERISGRFTCANCGEGYHDSFKQPQTSGQCDICGKHDFKRRADDNAEAVKTRLEAYHSETAPLLEYYGNQKLVQKVDAMGEIDQITDELADIVVSVGCQPNSSAKAV